MRSILRTFVPLFLFTCLIGQQAWAQCIPPTGIAINIDDCPGQSFDVQVDILTQGDAFTVGIQYTVNGGPLNLMPNLGVGTYFLGPFNLGDQVGVILEHDQNPACNTPLGTVTNDFCPVLLVAPYCESFDSYIGSSCSDCSTANPDLAAGGWQDGGFAEFWQTCAGPTQSTNTGPDLDNTGGGNFIYCEASGCNNTAFILQSPNYDVTALAQPHLTLNYHMFGGDLASASITIEVEDPAQSGFWTPVGTLTEPAGGIDQWQFYNVSLPVSSPEIALRFTGVTGAGFESDLALDDICVVEAPNCTQPTVSYTLIDDCANCSYSVEVNVTSLGDAPSLDLISDILGVEHAAVTSTGVYTMGPYLLNDPVVDLTVQHNVQPIFCSLDTTITTGCPIVFCPVTVIAPHCEDFDLYMGSSCGTCTVQNVDINSGGWQQILPDHWQTCAGPTTSTDTGPANDNTGGGNFIYCEATGCNSTTFTVQSPNYDVSALTQPHLTLWYHMWGGDLQGANISIEVEDPAQSNIWTPLTTITEPAAGGVNQWQFFNTDLVVTGPEIALRFTGTTGPGFESDLGLDDICVVEAPNCTEPTVNYTLIDDCAACQYTVEVDVTSIGDAPSLDLVSDLLGVEHAAVTTTGTYVMGPYPATTPFVQIDVLHNGQPIFCSLDTIIFTGCGGNYCDGGPSSTTDSQVESVLLNGNTQSINLTNNCPGTIGVQPLYCTQIADIFQGLSYNITIDFGSCSTGFISTSIGEAWIDFNGNGVFDPSESIGTAGPAAPPGLVNWSFTVPSNAVLGSTVLRVVQQETTITPLDPCASFFDGSTVDLGIEIGPNPGCTPAIGTVAQFLDCATNDLYVNVSIGSMGNAGSVDITSRVNGGAPTVALGGVTSTGNYQIGPFALTDTIDVILAHDSNSLCDFIVGQVIYQPTECATCGGAALMDSLCYGPNEDRIWIYQASSPNSPVAIQFQQGTIETNTFDKLTIYDGVGTSGPILYQNPAATVQLGGLIAVSSGSSLTMTLTTDGSVQCSTSTTYDPWEWTVACLDCTVPGATYSVVPDCIHREYEVLVNVDSTGSAATAHLINSFNTDTALNVGVGANTLGPFPMDTIVRITALNADNPLCRTFSPDLVSIIDSCVIRSCGADYYDYCYTNDDDAWFTYQSVGGIPMAITFTDGEMLANDRIIIYNGYDDFSAVIFNGNNGGNLAGLSVNSMNTDSVITMRILGDPTGSCDDGSVSQDLRWWVGCSMVGVDDLVENSDLLIYPNPAGNELFISLPEQETPVMVEVFDATGRNVVTRQLNLNGAPQPLDVTQLQNGSYILRIITEEWYKAEVFQIAR